MFADLLKSLSPRPTAALSPEQAERQLHLACAVLLVEVARADWEDDPSERRSMAAALTQHFALPAAEVDALIAEAEQAHDAEVSLHDHLRTLNDEWTPEQRSTLLQSLWEVAFADGELQTYEEHTIRRLADLLYLPHSAFIQGKLAVHDPDAGSHSA